MHLRVFHAGQRKGIELVEVVGEADGFIDCGCPGILVHIYSVHAV